MIPPQVTIDHSRHYYRPQLGTTFDRASHLGASSSQSATRTQASALISSSSSHLSSLVRSEQLAFVEEFEHDRIPSNLPQRQHQYQQHRHQLEFDKEEKPQTDSEEDDDDEEQEQQVRSHQSERLNLRAVDRERDLERKQASPSHLASLVLVESHTLVEAQQQESLNAAMLKIKQFEHGLTTQQKNTIHLVKDYLIQVRLGNSSGPGASTPPASLITAAAAAGNRLSRFPLHRSAPDVLARTRLHHHQTGQDIQRQHRSTPQQRPLADPVKPLVAMSLLDDLCQLVDEEEIKVTAQPAINPSKKRPRQPTMHQENPFICEEMIHKLCGDCLIPVENRAQVVAMINHEFGTWQLDVIVLAEFVGEHILSFMGMLVFEAMWLHSDRSFQSKMHVEALAKLLQHVETRYHATNPFHNGVHAADVCHTMFTTLMKTRMGELLDAHCQYAAILGAILHDVDHIGVSNDYLLKTNHEITQKYPSKTPMESMHAAIATEIVCSPCFPVLSRMQVHEQAEALMIMQQMILATALSTQKLLLQEVRETFHAPTSLSSMASSRAVSTEPACAPSEPECEASSSWPLGRDESHGQQFQLTLAQQRSLLRCVMHVCDLGHLMKPFALHHKWVDRLLRENERQETMWNAYIGDHPDNPAGHPTKICCFKQTTPRSPTSDMIQSQICFLESFALPAVEHLDRIPWLGLDGARAGVLKNVREWRARLDVEDSATTTS